VSAFAQALDTLLADRNLGVTAIYRALGSGPEIALRVIRSSPDQVADAFGSKLLQATDVLTVAIGTVAAIETGDTLALGAELLTVLHAERDATGTAWRVHCQKGAPR
jgi:hypothetical protein